MQCSECAIEKLTDEFLSGTVSENCNHAATWCLRCLVILTERTDAKCPQCAADLTEADLNNIKFAWNTAPFKFPDSRFVVPRQQYMPVTETAAQTGDIYVVLLSGEMLKVPLATCQTVSMLRSYVRDKMNIEAHMQKLIFNGTELRDYQPDHRESGLSNYGIHANSHIQLIVVLYAITDGEAMKDLVFDLNWGFPKLHSPDYLDGTCFVYAKEQFLGLLDYRRRHQLFIRNVLRLSMTHSGDQLNRDQSTGHHRITANLTSLPEEITHLYFVLSAWNAQTIGEYRNPSFKMYDSKQPDKQKCNYNISHANHSQAVIMCCVARSPRNNLWHVYQIGLHSDGNARDYEPIKQSIKDLDFAGLI